MRNRPYTSYFVVGTQRSGTTVTHRCLRGHPEVSALREELALDPFFTEGISAFTFGRAGSKTEQRKGRRHFFDALTAPHRTSETRACGVKCAFGHGAQARRFVEVVRDEFSEAKIIHVVRRDRVAQFGSLKRAQSTDVYHQTEEQGSEGRTMKLDPHEFVEYALAIRETNAHLRGLMDSHDVLTIEYEPDILHGDIRSNESLFEFVQVPYQEATWLQHRKVSPSPEDYITNYAALKDLHQELERELAEGRALNELRAQYRPPLWKRVYRTGKHWVAHPGYAAHQITQGLRRIYRGATAELSR